jgi:hypothetical protein
MRRFYVRGEAARRTVLTVHTVRKSYEFDSKGRERAKEALEGQASPDCMRLPQLR